MKEPEIRSIISIFYPLFASTVIVSQLLLLFLIFKNQSKLLKSMRIYLYNICAVQLITIISGFSTQCRMTPNQHTVAFICTGICAKIDRRACFLLHLLRDASSTAALFAIVHVFYYRYKILSHKKLSKTQVTRNFIIVHLPALLCMICQFINPSNHDAIVQETRKLHPNYLFEKNSIFGFSALESPLVKASTIMFTIVLVLNPIAALVYRRKIWKLLSQYEEYNSARIRHAKSMITGLTIQTLIPSICFLPLFAQFFFSKFSESGILMMEYFNSFLVIIPTLIDPVLSIIFVIPFRRMFFKYLKNARNGKFTFSKITDDELQCIRNSGARINMGKNDL